MRNILALGLWTNQMPRSFYVNHRASCSLLSLAHQNISTYQKPTEMDKNLAPVTTNDSPTAASEPITSKIATLQLRNPTMVYSPGHWDSCRYHQYWGRTYTDCITVPSWNKGQGTLLIDAPERVSREHVLVWKQPYEIGKKEEKKRTYPWGVKISALEHWSVRSMKQKNNML